MFIQQMETHSYMMPDVASRPVNYTSFCSEQRLENEVKLKADSGITRSLFIF